MSYTPQQYENHVFMLQEMLHQLTKGAPGQPTLIPSGRFDAETAEAVRWFQREHGLPVTGAVDRDTWDAIFQAYNQRIVQQQPPMAITPFDSGPISLCMGTQCCAIGLLQSMLWGLSHRFQNIQACPHTMTLDHETLLQVQKIQRISGSTPSETLTNDAWNQVAALYNCTCAGQAFFPLA